MSISDRNLRERALVFYEEDINAIEAVLDAFLKKSAAKCSLLVDKDGHMISARGKTQGVDTDTISALVAGSFAATKALANQFGEEDFTALFHQGRSGNLQLSLVHERALLTALFDDNTTIGMVRLYAKEAAKRLTSIFEQKAKEMAEAAESGEASGDDGFRDSAIGALDEMFGE